MELFVVLQQRPECLLSLCADERQGPASAAAYWVARLSPLPRPSMFQLLTGPSESPPCGRGLCGGRETSGDWREMHSGDRPHPALAAGAGGSNSEMSLAARLVCIGSRREQGRVKGTERRAGE